MPTLNLVKKLVPLGHYCPVRNLYFSDREVESLRSLGSNCYNGSREGNFCNSHQRLCDVICAYQTALAPSLPSSKEYEKAKEFFRCARSEDTQAYPLQI